MTTIAGIFLLPNGTFFIELIVSIILILLIYKYVLPPINKAMEERQEKIRTALERIVGNADVEIALARQRAVEEAASRMGEVVMEVVERIIGREVDADVHRDLIGEAVTALRDEPDSAAAGAGARP